MTSCKIPHLREADPVHDLPASYNAATNSVISEPLGALVGGAGAVNFSPNATSTENSAQLRIEEFYNDSTLTQLIHQALDNNRELKILEEEVQIASNEVRARQGAYLPFVTVGAAAGLDKPSLYTPIGAAEEQLFAPGGKRFPDPLGNFLGAINLNWRLDIWRELRNARDAAAQRYFAASERRNSFVTKLVAEVAENYFELLALDQRQITLDKTIELQEQSYDLAKSRKDAARGNELAVQRFQADVRKNQSEKLLVTQEIVEVENRINFALNRLPQPVERRASGFFTLNIPLNVGIPSQLLQNRPDIRQAECELAAAGLDVKVARAHFFPDIVIRSGVGYEAFNPKYLFNPESLIYNVAGELTAPLINKKAIQAEYLSANAKQLQAVYNYQRIVLNAYTEVINRVSKAENYRKSLEIRKQQLDALEASVDTATKLFQNARAEYVEVLLIQRDLMEAKMVLIDTKKQQLTAVANAYQALGGGSELVLSSTPLPPRRHTH